MAIDNIARGIALSMLGADGRIAADKMPTFDAAPSDAIFHPIGALDNVEWIQGKTAEEILLIMLFGIVTPTITEPRLLIALSDEMEQPIIGRQTLLKGSLTFDRGKIDPAHGTSGFRAGAPYQYAIGDELIETSSTSYDFEIPFLPLDKKTVVDYSVSYGKGDQPVDSIGRPVGTPLRAGTLQEQLTITAAHPLYSAEGEDHAFEWFEDADGEGYLAEFGTEVGGVRQSFAVSSVTTVIGVKAFNELTQQWEWLGSQTAPISLTYFDISVLPGENINEATNYILYTHNSTPVGARELKIYIE